MAGRGTGRKFDGGSGDGGGTGTAVVVADRPRESRGIRPESFFDKSNKNVMETRTAAAYGPRPVRLDRKDEQYNVCVWGGGGSKR